MNDNPFASDNKKRASNQQSHKQEPVEIDERSSFSVIKDELGLSKKEKTSRLSALKDELGIREKRAPKTTISFDDFDERDDEGDLLNEDFSSKETSKKSGRYFKWVVAIGSVIVLIIAILAS